uniref:Uncharacterized protein n=1 Tax=Rhizophora mucronata TaxID=61149 RepID=A0A2P2NRQ3_RHIMU
MSLKYIIPRFYLLKCKHCIYNRSPT